MGSQYKGVKFQVISSPGIKLRDKRIEEIIKWAKIFHQEGLAPLYDGGSYGNLSFRLNSNELPFLITASHTALNSHLSAENFILVENCDPVKNKVYTTGPGEPSSETLLHYAIYRARNDVNCILHGHCADILQAAERENFIRTSTVAEYGTFNLVQEVLEIASKGDFLIMLEHGFLSFGKTISAAGNLALKMLNKCNKK